MVCPRCNGPVWDNRLKKMDDPKWAKAPDFTCKDKDKCGWKSGDPAATIATAPNPPPAPVVGHSSAIAGPSGASNGKQAQLVALYWECFDEILNGLKKRSLRDGFHDEQIAACTATLFIQLSKAL